MNQNTNIMRLRLDKLEMAIQALTSTAGRAKSQADRMNDDERAAGERRHLQVVASTPTDQGSDLTGDDRSRDEVPANTLQMVEALIRSRRQRLEFFEKDLFFDPAWSIMLDLFRAELKEQRISVSSVCYGSGVPETTALRYVRTLEERGYIDRVQDTSDKRRVFLKLTPVASAKLLGYFDKMRSDYVFAKR